MLRIHGIEEYEPTNSKNIAIYSKNIAIYSKSIASDSKNIALEDNLENEDENIEYKCSKCSGAFKRKWNLDRHEKTCCIKNNHECEHCHKTFSQISSKYRHYKTCKDKIESEAKNVTIKNHCQEANVINNIENQNNHTQNIILVYKPENMEFIKDHIGESSLEYIKKVYPRIDRRIMMDYSKRILDLPVNRCIKKEDLRSGHSDVYLGDNKWEKTTDKHVYPELACSLANDMSSYINERRSKLKKEVFEKVIGFIDYMSDEGYINIDDKEVKRKILKEFRLFVKELKMVVFNKQD